MSTLATTTTTSEALAPERGLDLRGLLPGLPGAPGECLVAQIANELFHGVPAKPSGGESAVSAAHTQAPEIPGAGAGPSSPAGTALPSVGDAPLAGIHSEAPAQPDFNGLGNLGFGGVPSIDAQAPHGVQSAPVPLDSQAGTVPRVGEDGFLGGIGHELSFGFLPSAIHEEAVDVEEPGKGDLLGTALSGLQLGGFPAESVSHFYFLPDPKPEKGAEGKPDDGYSVKKDFPALNQKVNGKPLIWLDSGATTQKPQSVIDAIKHFYEHDNSNIHRAAHTLAARSTDAYEGARKKVQLFIGAGSPSEIVFTKGATEAVNLVANTFGEKFVNEGDEILVSELEHHANIVPWQFLAQRRKAVIKVIPIDDKGQIILDAYEKLLSPKTRLVAVAQVSNVLGTVPPVAIMAQLAHKQGARILIDGAQGAPHVPTNVLGLDADFYVVAGHKLFGPTGIGALYGKKELLDAIPPWQGGGAMIESVSFEHTTFNPPPAKFEAGTPPIAGAVGLGAAIDYVNRFGIESIALYEEGLMSYATAALSTIPGLRQIGTTPDKVGALAFVLEGHKSEDVGKYLDTEGIAVRAGHHCAQPALKHFGLTAAVRPSLSLYNTAEDIDALVAALRKLKK